MQTRVRDTIGQLVEAATWCESRPRPWDPKRSFRSAELDPGAVGCHSRDARDAKTVQDKRHKLLRESLTLEKGRIDGDLLVYVPMNTMAMGIGERISHEFLDVENVPPWDTWIGYFVRKPLYENLLSWVPSAFIGFVDEAIKAEPDESIFWWDRWHGAFRDLIEEVVQEVHRRYAGIRIGRAEGSDE